jgi:hypothetical protein
VTLVALPPNVLSFTWTAVVPHVLPLVLPRVTMGGLTHPHETRKVGPAVVQPEEFFTVIVWFPFDIPAKAVAL